ncbi:unnamed protein product, partial [marine sediment metagenome]
LGYTPNMEEGALRIIGNRSTLSGSVGGIGFHPEKHPVGKLSTRVSRVLSDICTASINIPVIKPHGMTGLTATLKNHYGTIDNPSSFHDNACTNPGIPEINAIPLIRNKERLIICNALQSVFKGGNRWIPGNFWPYGGIILGTDPVAVDRVCLEVINEKRQEEGINILGRETRHIELSGKIGIGISDLDSIDLVEINLT